MSKKTTLPKALAELLEAAENAVYWDLRRNALDVEEGRCEGHVKPGHVERLQAAVKAARNAMKPE